MKIVVFCEKSGKTGFELMAKARAIAPDARISALCEDGASVNMAGSCGADDTFLLPVHEDDCAQGTLIAGVLAGMKPDAALFPATIRGRFLSAWVAARLDTGLTADCTDLRLTPEGFLLQIRPAFGGNLTAEILCRTARPQLASVRPGMFPLPDEQIGKPIPETRIPDQSIPELLRRVAFIPAEGGTGLQNARVIVSGGKGLGGPKGFQKLERLAALLGGAVGATRSAVDAGWISYPHQIGQTGVVVHPDLYIAVGISGLVQHTVGMSSSGTVIAINKDRNAPIFRCADYGIVADWETVIDTIIACLSN